jgi:hypothetical protein
MDLNSMFFETKLNTSNKCEKNNMSNSIINKLFFQKVFEIL